ncbi:hypothetical protein [Variovorax sp. UMC13]|uniref:hypothetical protein n=1 Tax=Variovorax sp. UMC13 TaxID=1862326 RepID=UPI001603B9F2|nr:hypothetical protein [Variovorax sp. UMC13]
MTTVVSSAFLSASEVDELCAPLTQRHAQARHLCALLGLKDLPRRPDGLPLVGRRLIEERLNTTGDYASPAGFNWSR